MTPRVATSVLVGALVRRAEAEGGFAAVLARGDATAGTVVVLLTERGAGPALYERVLQPHGEYRWEETSGGDPEAVPELVARKRRFDPDLWVLELDIPSRERFAADMNAFC